MTKLKSKAICLCHIILRSFTRNRQDVCNSAYKIYVRPILEYNSEIWNACNKGEIRQIETVQRMFTRKLLQRCNMKYSGYQERLKILNLESLELRRLNYDIITVYKIFNNLIDISFNTFFDPIKTTYNLRHHTLSLTKPKAAKTNALQYSFKYRIVDAWNSLPNSLVVSQSLTLFKNGLKQQTLEQFLSAQ